MRSLIACAVLAVAMAPLSGGVAMEPAQTSMRELFERARMLDESNTGLREALVIYAQVAEQSRDRHLAATAQLRIGLLHERFGQKADAQRAFRTIVERYADQAGIVSQARARIGDAAPNGSSSRAMTLRRVWTGEKVDILGKVSQDGRYLSFVNWSTGDLGLRDLTTGDERMLTRNDISRGLTTYAEGSTISRDGRHVAYAWFTGKARYELRTVGVQQGAEPRRLYLNDDVLWISPQDWSPDGRWIAVQVIRVDRTAQIGLVSAQDGALRVLKSIAWQGIERMFFSPDGKYLAYDLPVAGDSQRDVFVLSVDGSREEPVVVHPARDALVGWSPNGRHLLFASNRTGEVGLWSVGVAGGKPMGQPELIRSDLGRGRSLGLTQSGALLFGAWPGGVDVVIASVDFSTGAIVAPPVNPIAEYVGYNWTPRWSPDGRQLAYVSRRSPAANGQAVVAIHSVDTGRVRELPSDLNYVAYAPPVWMPTGRGMAVQGTDQKGRGGIFAIDPADGAVSPLVIAAPNEYLNLGGWSTAGDKLYFRRSDPAGGTVPSFIERDIASGAERELIRRSSLGVPSVSPDGRWIAAPWQKSAAENVLLLIPVSGGEPQELMGTARPDRLTYPSWSPDSSFIVVRKESLTGGRNKTADEYWRVPVPAGEPRKLAWNLDLATNGWLSIHPDGRRVAYTSGSQRFEVWMMENVLPIQRPATNATRR